MGAGASAESQVQGHELLSSLAHIRRTIEDLHDNADAEDYVRRRGPGSGAAAAAAAAPSSATIRHHQRGLLADAAITTPMSRSEEAQRVRREIERHQIQSRTLRSNADTLPLSMDAGIISSSASSPSLLYMAAGASGGAAAAATTPTPAATDAPDARLGIHRGVECDGCGASPIRGLRFKCTTCPDYDLCRTCYRHRQDIHVEGHSFRWVSHHGGGSGRGSAGPTHNDVDRAQERMQAQQFIREANRHRHEAKEAEQEEADETGLLRALHQPNHTQFYCHQCQGGFSLPNAVVQASSSGPNCPTCNGFFVEQWEGVEPLQPVARLVRQDSDAPSMRGRRRHTGSRGLVSPSLPSVREVERVLQELQLLQAALSQRGDLLQRAMQEQSLQEDGNKPIPASEEAIAGLKSIALNKKHKEAVSHCSICLDCWDEDAGEDKDAHLADTKVDEGDSEDGEHKTHDETGDSSESKCGAGDGCKKAVSVVQLPCSHFFHQCCISDWLRRSGTCPICRHRVGGDLKNGDAKEAGDDGDGNDSRGTITAEMEGGDGSDHRVHAHSIHSSMTGIHFGEEEGGMDAADDFIRHLMPQTSVSLWHRDAEEEFHRVAGSLDSDSSEISDDELRSGAGRGSENISAMIERRDIASLVGEYNAASRRIATRN